ncbi:hypothetical protein QBC40DRAFT_301890 [Triangularia verruculosa]|uniref:Uncharacterized protein n=1 Tax=Triangularia verruculosa TaxID=2587418 RepID=A0AAN7AR65_9PEZI|nr:hypothetical protein QBC40DRAFT_301890 [Triangularia verruculosa]
MSFGRGKVLSVTARIGILLLLKDVGIMMETWGLLLAVARGDSIVEADGARGLRGEWFCILVLYLVPVAGVFLVLFVFEDQVPRLPGRWRGGNGGMRKRDSR